MNADDFARAIVAGAKETGADPVDVLLGNDRSPGYPVEKMLQVSRARAYAGRALVKVFDEMARPDVARLIGVRKPSQGSFFSSLDGRPTPWWDEAAFGRVISAVVDGVIRARLPRAPAAVLAAPKPPTKPNACIPSIGTLERGGFRPAPGTIKKVLRDDADEKRLSAPYVPVGRPVRKDDDFLRRAVENTAKMTPPPED